MSSETVPDRREEGTAGTASVDVDAATATGHEGSAGVVRRIGHDEYDPVGTLVLLLLYFVVIGVMWVFMYFVEFLGRGVTVVG
jgi:hypothetical protein